MPVAVRISADLYLGINSQTTGTLGLQTSQGHAAEANLAIHQLAGTPDLPAGYCSQAA
jgi:hypothetical protein